MTSTHDRDFLRSSFAIGCGEAVQQTAAEDCVHPTIEAVGLCGTAWEG